MVAVAGGIHGTIDMEALEKRLTAMEDAVKQIPNDVIEYWPHVREAIKVLNKQVQNIQATIDTNDNDNQEAIKIAMQETKVAMNKGNATMTEMQTKAEEAQRAMRTAEQAIKDINLDRADIRNKFSDDMKALYEKCNERSPMSQEGKDARDWSEKMKRADHNKPAMWGDSKIQTYTFEKFRSSVKRWGQKLHEDFSKMIGLVEGGAESKEWTGGVSQRNLQRTNR